MTALTLHRPQVHRTWLGQPIPWRDNMPPLRIGGFTILPARSRTILTETVSLTRKDLGLDRQAHPMIAIENAMTRGYVPCQAGLVAVIARMARPRHERHVIVVEAGGQSPIYYASGRGVPLQLTDLTLDEVRFIEWSVVLAKP